MICAKCGLDKPEKNFPVGGKRKDNSVRRSKICRACKRQQLCADGKCQCGRPLVTKTLCEVCRRRTKAYERKRLILLKSEILEHYGECCAFCGENEPVFLTIDHIDGNGAQHRREENISTGDKTYRWLKRNGFPDGFRVACFNCNAAMVKLGDSGLRDLLAKRNSRVEKWSSR